MYTQHTYLYLCQYFLKGLDVENSTVRTVKCSEEKVFFSKKWNEKKILEKLICSVNGTVSQDLKLYFCSSANPTWATNQPPKYF